MPGGYSPQRYWGTPYFPSGYWPSGIPQVPDDRLYHIPAESRMHTVLVESRLHIVPQEIRTVTV